jgi:hypothetical protein
MNNREINETRTKLLMKLAEAGRAALEFDPLAASALAAIPNTDPQQYVAAGTLKMIAKVLPSVDAPAVQAEQSTSSNEEILALHRLLAAEKLRADRESARADAKSRECIELRDRMAALAAQGGSTRDE